MDPSPTLPLSRKGTPSQMPSKKRKRIVLQIQELVSSLEVEPDNFETAWYNLRALVNDISTSSEATLAPSSLKNITEALDLFDLHEGRTDPFTGVQGLAVPPYLEQNIARIYSVTTSGPISSNEALSRMIIDQILVCCLYEEGQRSDQQLPKQATHTDKDSSPTPPRASDADKEGQRPEPKQATHADKDSSHTPPRASDTDKEGQRPDQQPPKQATHTHSSHTPPRTSDTNVGREEPAMLELLHETPLSRVVTHQGQTKRLCGFSNYSVWYDRSREGRATMATNLLIVEAKRQFYTDNALPQLASYMGIVHASRKDASKENCIVYGIASDGRHFRFCRIDNDGVFTRSLLLEWEWHKDQIYSIIRSLLRAAALSSPSPTPIKDPMRRKIVLASFGSPQRARKFDYGFSQLHFYDLDDLEDAEIVHLNPDWQQ